MNFITVKPFDITRNIESSPIVINPNQISLIEDFTNQAGKLCRVYFSCGQNFDFRQTPDEFLTTNKLK
jgi:hypothetical protein